ncbi:amino acid-binding protein [Sphaerisporangium melleum]|uniref:Amino acid-binding protein n=1 Tax=Sphaerisporangium melleum TaxID=321316 RepID=A0A917RHV0_9ACTN|nr:ACT domain-containing protein [Sphaerisporangium melleum]GGL07132.1 amino acid-binding protein [Sphaerisporangium melleum]GII68726.1 amino acid-binding protein [Sphaerisporangium melleum]
MLLRLRITLPDRPGSLGQVTRVLGVAGADITQLVVLERGEGRAVDDLTVYWPDAAPRETLVEALRGVPDVTVEGVWVTREAPGTYPELEILKYITTAGDRALATMIDSMPVLFSADWAAAGTEKMPRTVVHASWRAPEEIPFPPITPPRPEAHTLPSGLHIVAAPLPPLALTFLLARADGPPFHRIEVHRLTRILEIFLTLPAVERSVARTFRGSSAD